MDVLLNCCCGLDVHKDKIEACILKNSAALTAVRETFGSTRSELKRLCQWLMGHNCLHVAMESTGVYWQSIYDRIEEEYPQIQSLMVVNAHHMRNLPGRKTDVKDAEWIAQLLQHGLLSKSFVPEKAVRTLREISRCQRKFVQDRTSYSNRLEKFLQTHGFKLSSVVSSITGVSSMKMLKRLVNNGRLTLKDIEACTDKRLHSTPEEIHQAIIGSLDVFQRQMLHELLKWICLLDEEIARLNALMLQVSEEYRPHVAIAVSIPGLKTESALAILAEISPTPHESFENAGRLCSWAGLVPRNDESAGKVKSRKILHGNPYVKSMLVQCAWAAVTSRKSEFSKWYWARQGHLGSKKTIIAVARKILVLLYRLLQTGEFYDPDKTRLAQRFAPTIA